MSKSSELLQHTILKSSSALLSFFKFLHFALLRIYVFPTQSQLPVDLLSWRRDFDEERGKNDHWTELKPLFAYHGYILWNRSDGLNQSMRDLPAPTNYSFIPSNFPEVNEGGLTTFYTLNGLYHAARKDKRDYVVRVMSSAGEKLDHLNIIRMLSTSPENLLSNNHILPMVDEIMYKDIIFAVFPRVGNCLRLAMQPSADVNSVEDILYMIMQALEAIIFIHSKNVAHRDLFTDNFVTEWNPQSGSGQSWTRPRVYLIDFETAIHFPEDTKPSERLATNLPLPDEDYGRQRPPELTRAESYSYCPFRLDMFQFGVHLMKYFSETGVEEIDTLWPLLVAPNPADRPTAREVFQKLGDFIGSTPPKHLQREHIANKPSSITLN